MRFRTLSGQAPDLSGPGQLLERLEFGALIGDRAFDADRLPEELESGGAEAVIPAKRNCRDWREHDREKCKRRHQIEDLIAKLKEYRAIATRYHKTDESFAAAIFLVAGVVAAK